MKREEFSIDCYCGSRRKRSSNGKSWSLPKQSGSFLLGDSVAMDGLCVIRDCDKQEKKATICCWWPFFLSIFQLGHPLMGLQGPSPSQYLCFPPTLLHYLRFRSAPPDFFCCLFFCLPLNWVLLLFYCFLNILWRLFVSLCLLGFLGSVGRIVYGALLFLPPYGVKHVLLFFGFLSIFFYFQSCLAVWVLFSFIMGKQEKVR